MSKTETEYKTAHQKFLAESLQAYGLNEPKKKKTNKTKILTGVIILPVLAFCLLLPNIHDYVQHEAAQSASVKSIQVGRTLSPEDMQNFLKKEAVKKPDTVKNAAPSSPVETVHKKTSPVFLEDSADGK